MYIKNEMYNGKLTDVLYAENGFLLEHKITKLWYGSVSLEEGRKQEDYTEIKEPEHIDDYTEIIDPEELDDEN